MKDQDVEPAIVVEVVDAAAPTRVLGIRLRNSRTGTDVFESIGAGIAHQAVVLGIRHPEIGPAVAIHVGKYRSHRRSVLAVLSISDAEIARNFLESSVTLIVKEEVFCLVVCNVDVGISISVIIRCRDTHGSTLESADARLVGYVRERAVAVVVIETVGVAGL